MSKVEQTFEQQYNELIKREIYLTREHPLRFIMKHCVTIDEHDRKTPFKHFPQKEYIAEVVKLWYPSQMTLIPKSRQMMISWLMMGLHTWLCAFFPGQRVMVMSKDEDTAWDLIEKRAVFILENLPPYLKMEFELRPSRGELVFPAIKSEMKAFSSSDRSARSYRASAFVLDDMAHLPNCEAVWKAVKPTVDGGGRFTGVSTPNGQEFFWRLLMDKGGLGGANDVYAVEETPFERREVIRGIWHQKNRNGFQAIWVYYYADPEKDPERDGLKWYRKARRGFTDDEWAQEYEISFLKSGAEPVYPGFSREIHVAKERIPYNPDAPLLIGWDFGYRVQAVVFAQMSSDDRLLVLREITGRNVDTWTWCSMVKDYIETHFPEASHISFCDDAGRQKYETSDYSSFEILTAYGFPPTSAKRPIMFGVNLIRRLLTTRGDGKAGILIDPSCEYLIEGFEKGYHRADTGEDKPVKDGVYDHYMDALRYIVQNYIPNPSDPLYISGSRAEEPEEEEPEEIYQSKTGY